MTFFLLGDLFLIFFTHQIPNLFLLGFLTDKKISFFSWLSFSLLYDGLIYHTKGLFFLLFFLFLFLKQFLSLKNVYFLFNFFIVLFYFFISITSHTNFIYIFQNYETILNIFFLNICMIFLIKKHRIS